MIKAIKNCIKNSDYTESEKTQMLAWIECAIDFGKNLDEVAKENEQLKAQIEKLKEGKQYGTCPYRSTDMGCDYCDYRDRDLKDEWEENE